MRTALLFLIWLVVAPAAIAQARGDVTLFGHGEMNGPMYNWEVTTQRFEAQPKWLPTNPALPLTIPKAVDAAQTWIKKKNPEVKEFAVSSIAISPIGCCSSKSQDRWYYRIEFNPIVGGQPLFGGHFIAVVLFDGTLVEPRLEKR
jgi:hypothetical protein